MRLLRYTESTVHQARSSRWIELGRFRVIKLDGSVVHLSPEGRLNEIPNVSEPLTYDTPVRLVWKRGSGDTPSNSAPASPKPGTSAPPDPEPADPASAE